MDVDQRPLSGQEPPVPPQPASQFEANMASDVSTEFAPQNGGVNLPRAAVRCDGCKKINVKCNRSQPSCNNCTSAQSPCMYTPIPPNAHKGVARCIACKRQNIRCDRTLPVCNQCEDDGVECQYISGRKPAGGRKKQPRASGSAPIKSDASGEEIDDPESEERTQASQASASHSASLPIHAPQPTAPSSGRYSSHYRDGPTGYSAPPKQRAPVATATGVKRQHYCYIPPSVPRPVIPGAHIHPWMNPAFVALPEVIINGLARIPSVELPDRVTFHSELNKFLDHVMAEQRSTVCLGQEEYAEIADCLAAGRVTDLTPRVQSWAQNHHVMSGSDRAGLLLIPREEHFQRSRRLLDRLRLIYQCHVDGTTSSPMYRALPPMNLEGLDWLSVFQRLPVKEQIYDILAYAHRGHGSTTLMLMEVTRLGFAGISWPMAQLFCDVCPLCNMQTVTKFRNVSYSVT